MKWGTPLTFPLSPLRIPKRLTPRQAADLLAVAGARNGKMITPSVYRALRERDLVFSVTKHKGWPVAHATGAATMLAGLLLIAAQLAAQEQAHD